MKAKVISPMNIAPEVMADATRRGEELQKFMPSACEHQAWLKEKMAAMPAKERRELQRYFKYCERMPRD